MATVAVFVCPGAAQYRDNLPLSTHQVGSCASGQGSWQSVTLAEPFDPATLNSAELSGAFGAGFVVMGTGLAIAWAGRQIIQAIRESM